VADIILFTCVMVIACDRKCVNWVFMWACVLYYTHAGPCIGALMNSVFQREFSKLEMGPTCGIKITLKRLFVPWPEFSQ